MMTMMMTTLMKGKGKALRDERAMSHMCVQTSIMKIVCVKANRVSSLVLPLRAANGRRMQMNNGYLEYKRSRSDCSSEVNLVYRSAVVLWQE